MNSKLILHIDENHPVLIKGLEDLGFENHVAYNKSLKKILNDLPNYIGVVIRSRFPIDKKFINHATNLKFIARVGSGIENIDVNYAYNKNILTITAPEGNSNAVGEQSLGMLLCLMNKLHEANSSVKKGEWQRENYRGCELDGKTVGIIGYGNTGKSFAKKLRGFDLEVICHDIKAHIGDENAKQVSLEELQNHAKILSLNIPQSSETNGMIDQKFIKQMKNPFWFINTSRGKSVVTSALVKGLISKKILGAGLDVLEYESASFHSIFNYSNRPKDLNYLLTSEKVLLSPHVAGLTFESHIKLAQTIVAKVASLGY